MALANAIIVAGYGPSYAYSTDDGATWTDYSASLPVGLAAGQTIVAWMGGNGYWFLFTETWFARGTDVNVWLDGLTRSPLKSSGATYASVDHRAALHVPNGQGGASGARWYVVGGRVLAADSISRPVVGFYLGTPSRDGSFWSPISMRHTYPSAANSYDTGRNGTLTTIAFDPVARRVWTAGFTTEGNVILFYDTANLGVGIGSPVFYLATGLPAYLTSGKHVMGGGVALIWNATRQRLQLAVAMGSSAFLPEIYEFTPGSDPTVAGIQWTLVSRTRIREIDEPHLSHEIFPQQSPMSAWDFAGLLSFDGSRPTPYVSPAALDIAGVDNTKAQMVVRQLHTNDGSILTLGVNVDGAMMICRRTAGQGTYLDGGETWSTTGLPTEPEFWGPVFAQHMAYLSPPSLSPTVTIPVVAQIVVHAFAPTMMYGLSMEVPQATVSLTSSAPSLIEAHSLATTVAFLTDTLTVHIPGLDDMVEALVLSGAILTDLISVIREVLTITGVHTTVHTAPSYVADAIRIIDAVTRVWVETAADTVAITTTATEIPVRVVALIDSIAISGAVDNWHEAVDLVADAIALTSLLEIAPLELVNDTVAFAALAAQWGTAVSAIVEALAITGTALAGLTLTTVIADDVDFTGSALSVLTAVDTLSDTVGFYVSFRLGDEIYRGYVLNAANKAPSEYTNFEFNSMAQLGSRTFMAGAAGLFELTGSDDAGTEIEALVRTGLLSIADGKMARVDSAYVGYASDGTMVLKATVTSFSGEKQEHWYQLKEQNAPVPREGRIKLGLGLKSVYWQFELVNVSGSTLDLDSIRLHRVVLDRRI